MPTLSQRLGAFAAGLRFEDLPPAVVDKVKAVLLHNLFMGLASLRDADVTVMRDILLEDSGAAAGGARLLGSSTAVPRSAAAMFASVLFHARSQDDSYRMLTHPGSVILPAAFAGSDGKGVSGREFVTAIAAGYEIQNRIGRDLIPATQDHGFRSSALFGVFGPAIVTAKLLGLDAGAFAHTLAFAVGYAFGCLETGRAGTREMTFQEPVACSSGMLAAQIARRGVAGAPESLEGLAGLFYSFAGVADGDTVSGFDGERRVDFGAIAEELGERWEILNVTMKIYSSAGYTQPVIEAIGRLSREHDLRPADIPAIRLEMNEWETFYPSKRSPKGPPKGTDQHSTTMLAAEALAAQGYPVAGRKLGYGEGDVAEEAPEVRELAGRITVVPADRRQYAPRITIETADGRSIVEEMTGDEFKWDFAMTRERIRAIYPLLPFDAARSDSLVDAIAGIDDLDDIDRFIDLLAIEP